jgi:hypothetical protein
VCEDRACPGALDRGGSCLDRLAPCDIAGPAAGTGGTIVATDERVTIVPVAAPLAVGDAAPVDADVEPPLTLLLELTVPMGGLLPRRRRRSRAA